MMQLWCVALITLMVSQVEGTNYIPGKTILQITNAYKGPSGADCRATELGAPITEPPTIESPTTKPPTTEPPTTEPSTTKPPTTEPPTAQPPTADPPTTEPPITEPPLTEPPVTEPGPSVAPITIAPGITELSHESFSDLIAEVIESMSILAYNYNVIDQEKTEVEGYMSQLESTQEDVAKVNQLVGLTQNIASMITGAVVLRMSPRLAPNLQNNVKNKNLRNRKDTCVSADNSYLLLMKVLNQSAVELIDNPLNATATTCLTDSSAYASSVLNKAIKMIPSPPWLAIKDEADIAQADLVYSQYVMDQFMKTQFPEIEAKIRSLLESYKAHKEDLEKQLSDLDKQLADLANQKSKLQDDLDAHNS